MRARSINGKSGKKALVILLMACMIVNLFTGCSGGRSAKRESIDYHVELETPPEPTDKIVIYQAPDMSDLIEYALATYRAKFPNVEVELKEFGNSKDMSTYAEDLENYGTVLKSELMAGQGPDVILWDNAPSTSSLGSFSDIYKVMEAGSFYNLDNFIANDPEFTLADFNSEIIDNGVYKGERQYLPIAYSMNILVSSQETLDKNGISLTGQSSFAEFSQQIGRYGEEISENYNKYLFDYRGYENPLCDLVYPYNGVQLIDYERNEVMVDNDTFRDTMDFYKKIHGIVYTRFQNNIPYTLGGMSGYRALAVQNDQLLFADSSDLTLSMVGMDYCGLLALEQNPVAFGLPNINGGKTPAYTAQCAAIRKTSENKANAYEFIKILLSQTIQGDASDHIGGIDIPVHNDARMQKIKAFMQETVKNIGVTDGVACQPITTEQAEQLYRLFSEVSCIHSYSADVCGILWKDMLPYFEGTASYDKCVKNLKNDLTLYVAE